MIEIKLISVPLEEFFYLFLLYDSELNLQYFPFTVWRNFFILRNELRRLYALSVIIGFLIFGYQKG